MKLVYYPDPILGKGLKDFDFEEVKQIFADAADLKDQMVDVMVKHKGIGLSACQVGLDYRCFVMGESKETAIMVINPEIVAFGEETECEPEGCLSFPDMYLKVTRPTTVTAKWLDEQGQVSRLKWDRALKKKNKITKQRNQIMQAMRRMEEFEKNRTLDPAEEIDKKKASTTLNLGD